MFCKNCGKEIEDGKDLCEACAGAEVKEEVKTEEPEIATETYTSGNVVEEVKTNTNTNSSSTTSTTEEKPKSKIAAGLLGIFLGSFGVHNFYLGFTGKAVAQLLITILSCGILSPVSAIWGLIEGILYLTGSMDTDAKGNKLGE